MRMQKTILAGLLSGLLLIGSCLPAAASREADPQIETLYQDALSAMKEKGVPDSFPDGPFLTEAVLTREQGAVITASLILGKEAETPFGDSAPFADVSADRWSAPYIAWCRDRGILLGYGDGCFHPEDPLTGDQFAKMLLCALGTARDGKYADSGDAWAEAVRTDAALQGLYDGDASMAGSVPLTGGQAALMAYNALSLQSPTAPEEKQAKRKLIIDTDTGADDASALILAAKDDSVDILGVTTLVGNVNLEQSTQNALMALEVAGSGAPVYKGAEKTYGGRGIEAFSVFGMDGMGDADLIHPTGKAQEEDAISFIINTVRENPGEVELVVLGPATNIALAMKEAPEVMKQVKMIWSMGSAGLGPGNASPVAEFNVYGDAEAYRVMLDFGVPVTIVGLDVCGGDAMWTSEQFDMLEGTNEAGRFVSKSFEKIRAFYASNGSADATMNCDSVAMMCVLDPGFVKSSIRAHGSCITEEGETYAQVIFYQEGFNYDVVENDFLYNVTLVSDVKEGLYFSNYRKAILK